MFLILWIPPSWSVVVSIFGFVLLVLNVSWMSIIGAVISTRYRDMVQIIQNVLQVLFYATPIMWTATRLPEGLVHDILYFNPFLHLIQIVRAPLLGEMPTLENWLFSLGFLLVGWLVALSLLGSVHRRIAYWL